jgi:hypothetical protein
MTLSRFGNLQLASATLGTTSAQLSRPTLCVTSNSSRSNPVANMWRPTLLLAAALAIPTQALHFFIDGAIEKCFFEELPKDTLVVGPLYLWMWRLI